MVFEYILKKHNIDPQTDLSIDQSIDFGSTAAAFSGGQGDFTVEFEPHATSLETKGDGYVIASLGEDSGYVPYTAFSAKKSFIEETEQETITAIVTRYYEQDTWKDNLIFEEDSFTLLQNILDEAGELSERVPYETLVNVKFAEAAK